MRCVPHDEDTGGFFVCTLRKIDTTNKTTTTSMTTSSTEANINIDEVETEAEAEATLAFIDGNDNGKEDEPITNTKRKHEGNKNNNDNNNRNGRGLSEYLPLDSNTFDKVRIYSRIFNIHHNIYFFVRFLNFMVCYHP